MATKREYLYLLSSVSKNQFTSHKTTEKRKADQKEEILNPGTIAAVRSTIKVFITRVNKPKVKILIGIVRSSNIGLRTLFSIPKTMATATALHTPIISTPGTTYAAIPTATTLIINFVSPPIY